MFTVDEVVGRHYPALEKRRICSFLVKPVLRWMLHERAFCDFASDYPHLQGIEFIEQVFEHLDFSYAVADSELENIPVSGRVVIIANHPIGSLDGLALLKLVHGVRSDVRIVANELLMSLDPLKNLLLPVRVMTGGSSKSHVANISRALERDEAVVIFPAGEVSRLGLKGVRDCSWQKGFLKIALRAKAPILPVHIGGRNSVPFYLASLLAKPLSTLMLVGQLFCQREKEIRITVGAVIPWGVYRDMPLRQKEKVKLFKKHVYRIGAGKAPPFTTESAIARPERKVELKRSVEDGALLGRTPDGKSIYLLQAAESTPVMREIGRLREMTFRAVGEGTGRRRDQDAFDRYYQHLILWDEADLEVAGAYRFADAGSVIKERGVAGLYSFSLFALDHRRCHFLENGLELGRSFVQRRYWGKRSLDYLWYGIGSFLKENPDYRYLFGPVSISNAMPRAARDLLIYFYKLYFGGDTSLSCSRNPFVFSRPFAELALEFNGSDYSADFTRLKSLLANMGAAVPPLYKQYTELCEPGGVTFLDFNIDTAFNDCVDGLVIVDISRIKEKKRNRYLTGSLSECSG